MGNDMSELKQLITESMMNYEWLAGFKPCKKKPIVISAQQLVCDSEVQTLEGTFSGKEGDYLMRGVEGELYICGKEIFEKTYDWVMI